MAIFSSHELRGSECDVLIIATGALDRARLPTAILLERLLVALGRAKTLVHFILPRSGVVGSAARRFSCLVQPILSCRVMPPEPETAPFPGLTAALARHGINLMMLDGFLICDRPDPDFRPKLIASKDDLDPIDIEMARHKGWRPLEVDSDIIHLDTDALTDDPRFAALLELLAE